MGVVGRCGVVTIQRYSSTSTTPQATDAGMSAFRDGGEHSGYGGRGRICGASVESVAVVASVGSMVSVPRDEWGARDAWKAYGFIRFARMSCPFQSHHQEGAFLKGNVRQ